VSKRHLAHAIYISTFCIYAIRTSIYAHRSIYTAILKLFPLADRGVNLNKRDLDSAEVEMSNITWRTRPY